MEVMLAEGLSKQPLDYISKQIASMGFNCVRLTWPLFMITNNTLASVTVRQSFQSLGLVESIAGIQVNNPSIIDLQVVEAFQVVVSNLAENNLMVILDNHISKPGWCCSNSDGNGFFGDKYFDADLWIAGLVRMATMFKGSANVVGMSLRNEPRGPKQNISNWYKCMQKGAEAVHAANPNVLVIISGLNFDRDLTFLSRKQIELTFTGKLVFEYHWYAFSDGQVWRDGNPNQVCGTLTKNMMRQGGFLIDQGWPLFISEFGGDQRGTNLNDNRFLNCFFGVAAELDLDWAFWALQGSYYLREGVMGIDETYGALSWDWCQPRNSSFIQRLSALQSPFQGPDFSEARQYQVIFHPSTSQCVLRNSITDPLKLGPCTQSERWSYTPQKTLTVKGTYFCLQADNLSAPAKLGIICTSSSSKWELISESKMHLSTKLSNGSSVCLDAGPDGTILTNPCKCLGRDQTCDPASQWFKIVNSTKETVSGEYPLQLHTPRRDMDKSKWSAS
ncbi:glycosyl hydrolase 5 family protein-like [Aristolochia californica]|uniref:glycosyl hydrolase 5 family protein-like n=1 Tax=Aristolochia californica TaxID=171875 RepID=UPI0035DA20F8